jgi:dihydroorotase/N-acyl-D-amino-acid deacylase
MGKRLFAWFGLLVFAAVAAWAQSARYDVVIRNGHIIDGTGSPWYAGDIGIRDGRIAAIGDLASAAAKRTIDAHGMVVAPGFIDMLGQSELTILVDPHLPSKIYQGITTEITGEGDSAAPQTDATIQADRLSYEHYHLTPTGARSTSTSSDWRNKAWGSTWAPTWAPPRCGA